MTVTIANGKAFTSFAKSTNQDTNATNIATAKSDIITAVIALSGSLVQSVPNRFEVDTIITPEGAERIAVSCAVKPQ